MSKHDIKIIFLKSINEIRDEEWDACTSSKNLASKPIDIFSTHRFLLALEASKSVGENSGWIPHYIIIKNFEEVINLHKLGGVPLEDALKLITSNPAKNLGLKNKGQVKVNSDGDLCFLSSDLELNTVIANGKFMMQEGALLVKGSFEK